MQSILESDFVKYTHGVLYPFQLII